MANPISKLNLVINGVTTQLDVHDANALTTEIDSMGVGWVRFKCGLQICWEIVVNNNNVATGTTRHSFPMTFSATPILVATPSGRASQDVYAVTTADVNGATFIINTWWIYDSSLTANGIHTGYVAIGKWK